MAVITIRGAREHNLAKVDLDLPRGALVVLCGVSGSGKSSLAFDTLFVEGQRRYLEAVGGHRQRPSLVPPRVDHIEGLPPTLALAQRTAAPGPRSTVGSVAEIDPVLRVLLARAGTLHCPRCGAPVSPVTHDEIVASLLALPVGARLTVEAPLPAAEVRLVEEAERAGFSRIRLDDEIVRIDEATPRQIEAAARLRVVVDRIRIAPDRSSRIDDAVRLALRAGRGMVVAVCDDREQSHVGRPYCATDDLALPPLEPSLLSPHGAGGCPDCEGTGARDGAVCASCRGSRLSEIARAVRWRGQTLPELGSLPLTELRRRLEIPDPDAVESVALADLHRRIDRLLALRLGHRALREGLDTLSGSEIQRVRLARQVATGLSGVLVVLDEPTAGLEPSLVEAVIRILRELVDAGNTVLAVEHTPAVIRSADHAVEFGPGAGRLGGRVIFQGTPEALLAADTPTGRWLSGRASIPPRPQPRAAGVVEIRGDWLRGTPGPVIRLARGQVIAITGPARSGKSTLIRLLADALEDKIPAGVELSGYEGLSRPILADRAAARAARSMPATYVGLWDVLRELLASTRDASVRGLTAASFSLNTTGGRCEACRGTGEQRIELGPLPDVLQVCPVCEGRRFQRDVLEVRWKGLDASELLALPAEEAAPALAGHPGVEGPIRALCRVGLGHVPLGQPIHTLSGGEARLLAMARELARAGRRGASETAYLLDDPTVGLHPSDTERLVSLLRTLCDEGASAWLATVDPVLLGAADGVVEISPTPCG